MAPPPDRRYPKSDGAGCCHSHPPIAQPGDGQQPTQRYELSTWWSDLGRLGSPRADQRKRQALQRCPHHHRSRKLSSMPCRKRETALPQLLVTQTGRQHGARIGCNVLLGDETVRRAPQAQEQEGALQAVHRQLIEEERHHGEGSRLPQMPRLDQQPTVALPHEERELRYLLVADPNAVRDALQCAGHLIRPRPTIPRQESHGARQRGADDAKVSDESFHVLLHTQLSLPAQRLIREEGAKDHLLRQIPQRLIQERFDVGSEGLSFLARTLEEPGHGLRQRLESQSDQLLRHLSGQLIALIL